MIFELLKKFHQSCYNFCCDLLDDDPQQAIPPPAKSATAPVPLKVDPPKVDYSRIDHTHPDTTSPKPRPTIMKGFLCASFKDETSLGLAATVVAIDEWHAKKLLNAELKKYSLRLEDDDKLIEIDLHNPGVLLAMNAHDNWPGW